MSSFFAFEIKFLSADESRFRIATGGLRHAVAMLQRSKGGRCEIRTHEEISPLRLFESRAFNHSANLP